MTHQSIREEFEKDYGKEFIEPHLGENQPIWMSKQASHACNQGFKYALWSARWMAERIQIHTHSACSQDCCSDHTDKFIDKVLKELQ